MTKNIKQISKNIDTDDSKPVLDNHDKIEIVISSSDNENNNLNDNTQILNNEKYEIVQNPIISNIGEQLENMTNNIDVIRPKNFYEECLALSYAFYKWCAPQPKEYPLIFTPSVIIINWMIFLMTLLTVGQTKCSYQSQYEICFEAFYYLKWGGSTGSLIPTEPWRLITSGFHHGNFSHILTNSIILALVGWWIESKYGSKRLWIIFLTSVIGGNILSWIAYDVNDIIIGASGGAYGLVFLIFGDCLVNWETVRFRWTILIFFGIGVIICMFIEGFFAVGIAVFAHLGGAISSIWVSILILPNFYYRSWEKYLTIVAILCFLIQFVALPIIAFKIK